MTDIAELGYRVDSSGLVEGTKALDDNAAAADKAGAAAERLEKSQQGTGKSASFWANEQAKINARVQEMERIEQRTAVATKQAATATEARELNLQKLLGQINPTVAALNRLAEQEDRLARARDLGLLKPQVWQQYQNQLDATRSSLLATSNGMGRLNLHTIEAQQSVAVLFRALATGNFSQVQSSITSLTARSGALSAMFSATGIAVAGLAVGLGVLAASTYNAQKEMDDYNAVLLIAGNSAGLTASGLRAVADDVGRATGRYDEARRAVMALAESGRLSGDMLAKVATTAVGFAQLTGQDAADIAKKLEGIAKEPSKALLQLNGDYHMLTAAVLEHTTALEDQGRQAEAASYAMIEAMAELDRRTERAKEQTMALTGMVGRLRAEWQAFAGELSKITNPTIDINITQVQQKLAALQSGAFTAPRYLIPGMREQDIASLQEQLRILTQQRDEMEDIARGEAFVSKIRQDGVEAYTQINGVLDRAKSGTDKLEESTRRLKASYEALRGSNPDSALLKGVQFGANGSIRGGSYDVAFAQLVKDSQRGTGRAAGISQSEKDANSLARAYASLNEQMAQQIALYGDTSRVAATRYQIERGNLKGLRSDLAEVLIAQAAQLDAQNRQKEATQALTRLQSELNRSENQGLATARERLRILNEAKGEGVISDGEYDATLAKILSAGGDAPKVKGVDALYGGASGELSKLNKEQAELEVWYSQRIQTLDALRREESAINASYDAQALAARAEYNASMADIDDARRNVMLTAAEQGFGAVADIMRRSTDEQSGIYRAAFAVSKAFSVAKAALAAKDAVSSALTSGLPFPANIAAMATAAAAVANLVSEVSAVGMAHDGIHSVPTEGTWLLNKGERVLTAGTAAKMDATLDRIASSREAGPGAGGNVYAPTININGDPDARTVALVEQRVIRGMQQNYDRISSELTTGQGRVGKGLRRGNNVSRRVT